MSHGHQQNQFAGVPPQAVFPPGDLIWGSPPNSPPYAAPMPAPAPVMLVSDVSRVLNPLFTEFKRTTDSIATLTESVGNLGNRLEAVELAIKNSLRGEDPDSDSFEAHSGSSHPAKRARKSGADKSKEPQPERHQVHLMQDLVRETIYRGCQVSKMEEFKEGLSSDEFERRVTENPSEPWRPDFLKPVDDPGNRFWVDKILNESLKSSDAQTKLANGSIPKEFWTEEFLRKHILKSMWGSARKAVKISTDPDLHARAESHAKKGNQKARHHRLFLSRSNLATGDDKNPPFKCVVNNEARTIPSELVLEQVISDVFSDEFDFEEIPADVSIEDYQKLRKQFKYEGVPPFYRNTMWNMIFSSMDDKLLKGPGQGIQPRYYASSERGQRKANLNPNKVDDIPVDILYRCHLDKLWYDRLPEWKRKLIKPSPKGFEVDEELEEMELEYAQE